MEKNNNLFTESFEAVVTNFDNILDDLEVSKVRNASDGENVIGFEETYATSPEERTGTSTVQVFTELFQNLTSKIDLDQKMPSSKAKAGKSTEDSFSENTSNVQEDLAQLPSTGFNVKENLNETTVNYQITTPSFLDKLATMETHVIELVSDAKIQSEPLQNLPIIKPMKDLTNTVQSNCEIEPICIEPLDEVAISSIKVPKSDTVSAKLPINLDTRDTSKCCDTSEVVFRTRNPIHVINFEWSLENFQDYLNIVHSAEFSAQDCKAKWQFFITFKPIPDLEYDMMEVFITRIDNESCYVKGEFDLLFLDRNGYELNGLKSKAVFTDSRKCHSCTKTLRPKAIYDLESDILKSHIDELIIKGTIKFQGCCLSTEVLQRPVLTV